MKARVLGGVQVVLRMGHEPQNGAGAIGESGDMMVLMWSLFLLNAVFGYWRWHMGAKRAAARNKRENKGETACDAA